MYNVYKMTKRMWRGSVRKSKMVTHSEDVPKGNRTALHKHAPDPKTKCKGFVDDKIGKTERNPSNHALVNARFHRPLALLVIKTAYSIFSNKGRNCPDAADSIGGNSASILKFFLEEANSSFVNLQLSQEMIEQCLKQEILFRSEPQSCKRECDGGKLKDKENKP